MASNPRSEFRRDISQFLFARALDHFFYTGPSKLTVRGIGRFCKAITDNCKNVTALKACLKQNLRLAKSPAAGSKPNIVQPLQSKAGPHQDVYTQFARGRFLGTPAVEDESERGEKAKDRREENEQ